MLTKKLCSSLFQIHVMLILCSFGVLADEGIRTADFEGWLSSFETRARAADISQPTLARTLSGLKPIRSCCVTIVIKANSAAPFSTI